MTEFEQYMKPGKCGYLIGIGGVSMSSLAEVLRGMGIRVSGSDTGRNDNVISLESKGFPIFPVHAAENITDDVDFVVRTAAVHDDNPEIMAARAMGIPVFERTQAWGAISREYRNALCISGTHGKTTTTSMCTHILLEAEKDPTVMIGGTLPLLSNAGHRVGKGDTIVMESCEYYNSFLAFFPTVAVILNVEEDHLDFFKDLADIQKSFRTFAEKVPENTGVVVANADDANTRDTLAGIQRRVMTFGLTNPADVTAVNIRYMGKQTGFDILVQGEFFASVLLQVPGEHNVRDALAATAACICLGVPADAVQRGLESFTGAGRRFEWKGSYNGADVYDDYAHHPSELKSLLDMVETLNYKRTILVFQPHTYTRTKALFPQFTEQLRRPDVAILAEIFAAREKNTIGISSSDLQKQVEGSCFCPTFSQAEARVRAIAGPGDIVLTVGAGNVYQIGENLVK